MTTDVAYKFADLSEEAKQTAIEHFYDINIDHEWWRGSLEDAENIGLKIEEFDLGRRRSTTGRTLWSGEDVCKAIISEHGESCGTNIIAVKYAALFSDLSKKYLVLEVKEKMTNQDLYDERQELDSEAEDLNKELLNELLDAYYDILQNEFEYLQSEKAIIETIESNDYEFEEDGTLI